MPHKKLLDKLMSLGINGDIHQWIAHFLINFSQCVLVDGEASSDVSVDSGFPQGAVLDPCCFYVI